MDRNDEAEMWSRLDRVEQLVADLSKTADEYMRHSLAIFGAPARSREDYGKTLPPPTPPTQTDTETHQADPAGREGKEGAGSREPPPTPPTLEPKDSGGKTGPAAAKKADGPPRGHRLPDPWEGPSEGSLEWAKANVPHLDVDWHTADFTDYWHASTGANATKRDWQAAWRNWMRKAAGGKARGRPVGTPQRPAEPKRDEGARRIQALKQNRPDGYT